MSGVVVQTDSFRSIVVVTLSVNVMRVHLYYCSMRCLYCNMFAHYHKLQAYTCGCVCICMCACVDVSGWICL